MSEREGVPFNVPYATGSELANIEEAVRGRHTSSDGPFSRRCERWLEARLGCQRALLVHSCTAALEMCALLLEVGEGDEVILPSYTFVSTANAFVLRGATPVFVDIDPDTLNLSPAAVEAAINDATKAIVAVHYAGVACDMMALDRIACGTGAVLVEDAAQAVGATYEGRPLGGWAPLAALSFHETKNLISGEGGALLINQESYVERAEILRDKGTDRSSFLRGERARYQWMDLGSSYGPSEIVAAFLAAQLDSERAILENRLALWQTYHQLLEPLEVAGLLRRPVVPSNCQHNAHLYYVLVPQAEQRGRVLESLRDEGIDGIFHYVPLHSAPAGRRYGRVHGSMKVTDDASARLVRLPLWMQMTTDDQERVVSALARALELSP
ncbi:MAG: dTDP-4-amino-4,6-dideoxygalactose transaminase [Acidobacteriota bacterium]